MDAPYEPQTLTEAIRYYSDELTCISLLASVRWPDGQVFCSACGEIGNTIWLANQKRWKCRGCKKQFSVKVGTIFQDSPIGLDKWLVAVWLLANCKNGVSSYEISRAIGVTQKCTWHMLHRIRKAMTDVSFEKLGGSGPIEVDETFIGGIAKNMHAARRIALKGGLRAEHKTAVMGMLDRNSRQVRAKVVPNVRRETLQNEILNQIEHKSTVYTDGSPAYDLLKAKEYIHDTVTHIEEYVRGEVHTQGIENFWSLLKRGLKGTYVAVEPYHLDRYVAEQVFRFNLRKSHTDAQRFKAVLKDIVGRRLTYAELTGRLAPAA
jgi:transposase-like protein